MADHPADVEALGHAVDGPQVVAVGLPVPVEALEDARGRDVLYRLHQRREPRLLPGAHRCERHAAVAEHDRRDAVPARRRRVGIPRELRVEVGVDVDEAGRHDRAVGVDGSRRRVPVTSPTSTIRSPSIAMSPEKPGAAGAVDDRCRRGSRGRGSWRRR